MEENHFMLKKLAVQSARSKTVNLECSVVGKIWWKLKRIAKQSPFKTLRSGINKRHREVSRLQRFFE